MPTDEIQPDGQYFQANIYQGLKHSALFANCRNELPEHLARASGTQRVWLCLDGFDEVQRPENFQRFWAILDRMHCRVLITSRPYARHHLPFKTDRYRLAPFSHVQSRSLVKKWFPEGPKRRRLLWLLRQNLPIRGMDRNAYLLTLICAISESDEEIPQEITRIEFYYKALYPAQRIR